MTDRAAVVVALAAVFGAFVEHGLSWWAAGVIVGLAFAIRRPWLLAVAVLLLTGGLAARARAGLAPPAPGPYHGWVTVLADAEPVDASMRADVRLADGRHVQARASRGPGLEGLRGAAAGERLLVSGTVARLPSNASWLTTRHISGVLAVDDVRARSPGALWARAANAVRGLLVQGADGLPARDRPLFLGFVLGDTRGQPADITDDFRGAGLSHLLAVSGQNVAFVLALGAPLLRRLALRSRLPATLAVILFFALVTRFEPSVLRASAMAALAVTASTIGRTASSVRLLALAVTALVVLDPFLVHSVGFQLSAGACIGIVALSPVIVRALPLPRGIADPLAVTVAAQVGVAPVLIAVFGGVPVAGLPANVLAVPLAGPVMVWGLSAGMVAGALGGTAAHVAHWPTHLMIGWIAWVAHRAALLPLGEIGGRELVVVAAGGLVTAAAGRLRLVGLRRSGVALMMIAVAAPAVTLQASPPLRLEVTSGATLWRAGGAVLEIDGRVHAGSLLESLRRAGVTQLAVVVGRTASATTRDAISGLRRRYDGVRVVLPSNTFDDVSILVGQLRVDARPEGGHLLVEISFDPTGRARGPPV